MLQKIEKHLLSAVSCCFMISSNDLLSRQPFIDLLKSVVASKSARKEGYCIAIDGEWGSGKTWILDSLEQQLAADNENPYLIFRYNAWDNDFYAEPLNAVLSVVIQTLNKTVSQKSLGESVLNEILKEVFSDLLMLASGIAKHIVKIDIEKSLKRKCGLLRRIRHGKKIENTADNLLSVHAVLDAVRESCIKLSYKVNLVLFVDELDRCLPEYAIKVLERLHHICNGIPIVQVIAYCGRNLAYSIGHAYGKNFEPCGNDMLRAFAAHYLEKFIDLQLPIDFGVPQDSLFYMYDGLESSYTPQFRDDEDFLKQFFKGFLKDLPIRSRKKLFDSVRTVHELTLAANEFKNFKSSYELLCCELLVSIDRMILHGQTSFSLEFRTREHEMYLAFAGKKSGRYSEIMSLDSFMELLNSFSAPIQKNDVLFNGRSAYTVFIGSPAGIVLLSLVDCGTIRIECDGYIYPHGLVIDIINSNKAFMEKFSSLLYDIL